MNPRNLRNVFMAGAALRHLMLVDDGDDSGGAGGAPPAADPPAGAEGGDPPEPVAGEGGDGGAGAGGEGAGDDPPSPKPQRTPWQAKRIDALTAQAKTAQEEADRLRRENEQAQQQIAAYKALYGDNAAPPPGAAPAPAAAAGGDRTYTQAEVQAEAQRLARLNTLNQKCETLFDQGAKTHAASWNDRVNQAGQAFGRELLNRDDFFEALTDLPNAVEVYHELAGDLDHMSEVLAMTPIKLGKELANMSNKLAAKPKAPPVSKAPTPIEPIDGAGAGASDDLAKMSMTDYAKVRERQREERFKERGR